MPLYRCLTRPGGLDDSARATYAAEVTDINCDVTGAPREFVHVMYLEDADGTLGDSDALVFGTIRSGRTYAQKADLASRLATGLAGHLGVPAASATAMTVDIPAGWVMEGGRILPEPGEEAAWMAESGPS